MLFRPRLESGLSVHITANPQIHYLSLQWQGPHPPLRDMEKYPSPENNRHSSNFPKSENVPQIYSTQ